MQRRTRCDWSAYESGATLNICVRIANSSSESILSVSLAEGRVLLVKLMDNLLCIVAIGSPRAESDQLGMLTSAKTQAEVDKADKLLVIPTIQITHFDV